MLVPLVELLNRQIVSRIQISKNWQLCHPLMILAIIEKHILIMEMIIVNSRMSQISQHAIILWSETPNHQIQKHFS